MRLMTDVEKTRISLSGDDVANIDVDNIVNDEALEMEVTREQFKASCQDQID